VEEDGKKRWARVFEETIRIGENDMDEDSSLRRRQEYGGWRIVVEKGPGI